MQGQLYGSKINILPQNTKHTHPTIHFSILHHFYHANSQHILYPLQYNILYNIMGNNPKNSQLPPNSVVIITGASSGLGKELAIKLSKSDIKLIITGRNKDRLQ